MYFLYKSIRLMKRHAFIYKAAKEISVRLASGKVLQELKDRGFIHDFFPDTCEPEVRALLSDSGGKPQTAYAGFDPTADSLHIGNLLVLMALLHWQRAGHNAIVLLGGTTALFGDPSGKSESREKLSKEEIHHNLVSIRNGIQRIVCNHQEYFWDSKNPLPPIRIVNNATWYKDKDWQEFNSWLMDHFQVGQLLGRKSIRLRLQGDGMKFSELFYQLLQSYDWKYLYENYNCRIQIGGKDQLGNFNTGYHFVKKFHDEPLYSLLLPLVKNLAGNKYGKSAGEAIWLDPHRISPYEFYQFFLNRADTEVESFLKLFTFLPLNEIEDTIQKHMANPDRRHGQKKLAENVTLLIFGEKGLQSAKLATKVYFEGSPEALLQLSEEEVETVFKQTPRCQMDLNSETTVLDVAMQAKCFRDTYDAERIIKAGGFSVNNHRETNPSAVIMQGVHVLPNNLSVLRVGKKNYYLVKWRE